MIIPKLNPTNRSREYNSYSQEERDKVIYNYLFNGLSHRDLDKEILKMDADYSRGWQSMGILHHIGLKNDFKGLFAGMSEDDAIKELIELNDDTYMEVIDSLIRVKSGEISAGIYDSWEIINEKIIIKTTDKSVFEFHGSGVPKGTIDFWVLNDLSQGEKRIVKLVYRDTEYEAYFRKDIPEPNRIRLLWHSDFESVLRTTFPEFELYENDKSRYPLIRFEKINEQKYEITLIVPEILEDDMAADEDEDIIKEADFKGKKEGQVSYFYSKKYERNKDNREAAIKIHGCKCACCGFDFEKVYGERGAGFIEIHHNKPLYSLEEEIVINPMTDLIPVCSNCHRMIHRRKDDVLSIEYVQRLIYNIHNTKGEKNEFR